jgi:D-serine transporter
MVLVGLICGITLFVEVGVVLLIPLAFSIAKKTHTRCSSWPFRSVPR